ncbi:uncharacterized protein LOC127284576 [Leptopilina boulardi]|uniref:uncharacterized protein LOC127284576 n=1 Tax=Leptopilina boulardi TaxID=63433 RepID=UPI0021F61F66|nr:uncharacterized protein LOC127284576 [Leptopilina boulardi]
MKITPLLHICCFLYFNYNYGNAIELNEVKSYLADVNSTMWNIVKNYGLSNLPVPDYQLPYNVSCFGYKLLGSLYLKDGFAFDFSKFLVDERKIEQRFIPIKEPNQYTIKGVIEIKKMQIFQDFKFEFQNITNYTDKAIGSVIIEPDIFTFLFNITVSFPSKEIVAIVDSLSDIKPGLKFYPNNGLTQRLRKQFFYEAAKKKEFVLDKLRIEWKPIFDTFLKEAVKQVNFPKFNIE